ncbi:NADH dehydrogenase [ubiquinone] 1 alpha subcomplex assembly factor 4 [Colossoma macropomum]|uniref:NADH dehydrogenase [ubiquinone] 1 alpha subcomplex assembly factor 4 n=1 Tax=Colossoma macropomum TaxID=42526 RepID=UPI001863FE3D|nr:NADH dehydrogenase [ubiquinone] 1 alpha subcomplex assembly factor 4 [Colossoma macropomum]
MGARVGRLLWRFNVESRAHKEISKSKPEPAPRHETFKPGPVVSEEIHRKDDPLLFRLKQLYVESKDPVKQTAVVPELKKVERRPLKHSFPGDHLGIGEITDVPVGKISIVEALKVLNDHKRSPQTWTLEKIAQDYSLQLKDAKALVEFFIPFEVKIIPPKSDRKQIKSS